MTTPFLVPCLVALRAEYNRLAPGRDKGADGWIGDAAHQSRTSDHNPRPDGRVLAVDVDSTGPWPEALDLNRSVIDIVDAHRAGADDRLQYVIWQRQIASVSSRWLWMPYDGEDPHTGHAHFSARHDLHGSTDTSYWGVCMNQDDVEAIAQRAAVLTVTKLLTAKLGHSDVTVAQALQNTEIETRGLADFTAPAPKSS